MAIKPLLNESELLQKIAQGDQRAFTTVFRWYGRPLGEFVLKLTGSPQATQEIVQDAFIKIWQRRETLPEIISFSNYLFIICRNQAFAVLKKIAAEPVSAEDPQILETLEISEPEPGNDYYQSLIEAAVSKLPAQQQKVYRLSRYERLKHEEIALQLGLSAETVKKHIQLAVRSIQKDVGTRANFGIILALATPLILH